MVWISLIFALFFASCSKHHLYVVQEWVDRNELASSHVNTPDPRQADPPFGQKLLISWDFPLSTWRKEIALHLSIRFWDNTQEMITRPVEKKRGFVCYYFPNKDQSKNREILTYKIDVETPKGEVVETFYHQLWTPLIAIEKETDPPL